MKELLRRIVIFLAAAYYGAIISIGILKLVFTKGYRAVFYQKERKRPAVLDDAGFGTHGFLTLEDGVKIHYVASGPEDKPLMLFLHGFTEFWYSWRHQIREFQKDYRVVAVDMRGYGESGKPDAIECYTLTKFMIDIKGMIQGLGYKSCTLVAHDLGGVVSWAFANRFPDFVDRMIIINAPASPAFSKVLNRSKEQRKRSWYVFFFQLPFLPELYVKLCDYHIFDVMMGGEVQDKLLAFEEALIPTKLSPEDVDVYKYAIANPGALTATLNFYRAALSGTGSSFNLEYQCPVLVIWGLADPALTPAILDQMEKDCPSLVIKRFPEGGHYMPMERPEFVNQTMRQWLDQET